MKNIITIIVLLISQVIGHSQTSNYELLEGSLTWKGKAAFSNYYLSGTLNPSISTLKIEDEEIIEGEIIIDMLSLNAENDQLESHLRSKDFFEVKKYQTATFDITNTVKISNSETVLSGNLTIKDKTLPIDVKVVIADRSQQIRVSGKMTVDRTSFGIFYNSPNFFKNLKEHAIADDFELEFDLTYMKK